MLPQTFALLDRRTLFRGVLFLLIAQLASLAAPYLVKLVIDDAIIEQNSQLLWQIAIAGILIYATSSLSQYAGQRAIDASAEEFHFRLRNQLFGHLQGLSLRFHNAHKIGQLMSRVHADSHHCKQLVRGVLPGVLYLLVGVGGTAVILLILAPRLFLVALIPLPALLLVGYIFRHRVQPFSRARMESNAKLFSTLHEALSGVQEIKAYGGQHVFSQRLQHDGQAVMTAELKLAKEHARLFPLLNFSIAVVMLAVLVIGGQMVIAGTMSIGTLIIFYYYISRSLGPVRGASSIVFGWHNAKAAMARVNELLESEDRLKDPEHPKSLSGERIALSMHNLTFSYTDLETGERFCAIKDQTLEIPASSDIAILGPSGSGKSTTGKLILRLFDPDEGSIAMNGVPLPELAVDDVRRHIGYVGQEVFLFDGSIRDNICFGVKHTCSDEDITHAVHIACVDEILERKSVSLDDPVGEKGVRLSGGQKKRIALARALLRKPSILIIDQLASDLEEGLNRKIFQAVNEHFPDISIVYLGHRIPAGFQPDEVYWMEHGALQLRSIDLERERTHEIVTA